VYCGIDATSKRAGTPSSALLRLLPTRLLVPVDVAVTRTVQHDRTVNFEGRACSVPFVCCGRAVEVRVGAEVVQALAEG
jgi:hypothetical protein